MTHVIEVGNPQGAGERDGVLTTPCPKNGDVILTRPLLKVDNTVGGGLENLQGGQIYLQNARTYGSAQPKRIKNESSFECFFPQ